MLLQPLRDGVCGRGFGGGGEKGAPEGEWSMSQLELELLLVGQAAGFRFLPGYQGFQRWEPFSETKLFEPENCLPLKGV